MPKIIINNAINLFLAAISILVISNRNSFDCCLTKLLSYILFEKYIYILALEMASPENRHCDSCIGTVSLRTGQEQHGVCQGPDFTKYLTIYHKIILSF